MALVPMENFATLSGTQNGTAFTSTSKLSTVYMSNVTFEKDADQDIWFGGILTYTLTITNPADETPISNMVIEDALPSVFVPDEESVTVLIGGFPVESGDVEIKFDDDGVLTITLDESVMILPGQAAVITFRGEKE